MIIFLLIHPKNKSLQTIQSKLIKNINNNYNYNIKSLEKSKTNPLLILEIPKIELSKKIYNIESNLNNIEKNIEIISESSLENNTIILASHSGNNKNAYFNNLIKLSINDLIYIYRDKIKYTYQLDKIYYINKTGYLEISKNLTNKIILVTCSLIYQDKQLIVEGILIQTEKY